jgi:hypothetical protein
MVHRLPGATRKRLPTWRHFFLRQDILAAAVAELKQLLHHRIRPFGQANAHLHEALGTASVLGRHTDELVAGACTAPLRKENVAKDQRAKVIMRLASFIPEAPNVGELADRGEIREQVNMEPPMSQRGISNHIEQLRPPRKTDPQHWAGPNTVDRSVKSERPLIVRPSRLSRIPHRP